MNDEDPGWPPALFLPFLIPLVGPFLVRRSRRGPADGLLTLRQIFFTFCMAILSFGFVLTFLESSEPKRPGVAATLLALGVASMLGGRLVERPLKCGDAADLKQSYMTRFFLRVAFSEAAALLGFVGFFLSGEWWSYPAGAAVTFIGFARAAPTRHKLQREQEELRVGGCGLSLVQALRASDNRPLR